MPDIYVASEAKKKKRTEEKPTKKVFPPARQAIAKEAVKAKKKPRKKTVSPLGAFVLKPANLRFETQEEKEKIVLLLRRHPITNVGWLLATLLLILFPLFVVRVISLNFIPPSFRFILTLVWYLLTFAFAFERFLTWFFNVNILTDERIVDVDLPSILYRDISSAKIDQMQDISVKIGGFIRSLFNYGDVLIQTAGTVPEICFEAVPNPSQVSEILNELILEEEQEKLDGRAR